MLAEGHTEAEHGLGQQPAVERLRVDEEALHGPVEQGVQQRHDRRRVDPRPGAAAQDRHGRGEQHGELAGGPGVHGPAGGSDVGGEGRHRRVGRSLAVPAGAGTEDGGPQHGADRQAGGGELRLDVGPHRLDEHLLDRLAGLQARHPGGAGLVGGGPGGVQARPVGVHRPLGEGPDELVGGVAPRRGTGVAGQEAVGRRSWYGPAHLLGAALHGGDVEQGAQGLDAVGGDQVGGGVDQRLPVLVAQAGSWARF